MPRYSQNFCTLHLFRESIFRPLELALILVFLSVQFGWAEDNITGANNSRQNTTGSVTIWRNGNLTVSGQNVSGPGGAIYADGDVNIIKDKNGTGHIIASGNTANGNDSVLAAGGAIYSSNGNVLITGDGNFTDNTANSTNGTAYGGAIATQAGNVTLNGTTTFLENKVATKNQNCGGGAIGTLYGNVYVYGQAHFVNNTSEKLGGAIFTYGENGTYGNVTLDGTDVAFTGNNARNSGGAVYSDKVLSLGGKASFTNNTAGENGGAVYSTSFATLGGNQNFTSNHANSGGALFAPKGFNASGNISFASNGAGDSGGGVTTLSASTLNGELITFFNNTAATQGGGLWTDSNLEIGGKANFTQNKVTATNSSGGAISQSNSSSTLTINGTSVTFENNTAVQYGGAIYTAGNAKLLGNITFANNSVTNLVTTQGSKGGALYTGGNLTLDGDNITFTGNSAVGQGGAIYVTGANQTSLGGNALFVNNTVSAEGGSGAVIFIASGSTVVKGNASFANNRAPGSSSSGGALYQADNTSTLQVGENASFTNNSAYSGGAIYSNAQATNITGGQFANNTAISGGTIYLKGAAAVGGNTSFINNAATVSGGAIYTESNLTLTGNVTFQNNTYGVGGSGGAIQSTNSTSNITFAPASGDTIKFATTSDSISGNSGLVFSGNGTVQFNASNSYTGSTWVNSGTIEAHAENTLLAGNSSIQMKGGTINAHVNNTLSGQLNMTGGTINADTYEALGSGYKTVETGATVNFLANGTGSVGNAYFKGSGNVTFAGNISLSDNFKPFNGTITMKSGSNLTVDNGTSGTILMQSGSTLNAADKSSTDGALVFESGSTLKSLRTGNGTDNLFSVGKTVTFSGATDLSLDDTKVGRNKVALLSAAGGITGYEQLSNRYRIGTIKAENNVLYADYEILDLAWKGKDDTGTGVWTQNNADVTTWQTTGLTPTPEAFFKGDHVTIGSETASALTISGKVEPGAMKVVGSGATTFVGSDANAVIAPTNGMSLVSSGDTTFQNLTISGSGGTQTDGTVAVNKTGGLTEFQNVTFSGNSASGKGGAIYAASNIILSGKTTFTGNSASEGGAIYLASGASATLSPDASSSITFATSSDSIAGAGSLIVGGSGTVTFNATNTYSGGTSITGGTINANADSSFGTGNITATGSDEAPVTVNLGTAGALGSANINLNELAVLNITSGASGDLTGSISGDGRVQSAGNVVLTSPQTFAAFQGDMAVSGGTLTLGASGNPQTYLQGLNSFTLQNGATLALYTDQTGGSSVPFISMKSTGGVVNLESGSRLHAIIGPALAAEKTGTATYTYRVFENAAAGSTFNAAFSTSNTLYTMRNGVFGNGRYSVELYRNVETPLPVPSSDQDIINTDYDPLSGKSNIWLDTVFSQGADGSRLSATEQARAYTSNTQTASLSGAATLTHQLGSVFSGMIPTLGSGGISPLSNGGMLALYKPSGTVQTGLNGGDDLPDGALYMADAQHGSKVASSVQGPHMALWATPMFRQGWTWDQKTGNDQKVGTSSQLYGVLLGGSLTFGQEGQYSIGALFSLGSAYTKSSGDLAKTTDSARYNGEMLYAQWRPVPQAEITAYGGLTHINNDVRQDNVATLKSEFTGWLTQYGALAEYAFALTDEENPWLLVPGIGVDVQHYHQEDFFTHMNGSAVSRTSSYDSTLTSLPITLKLRKTMSLDDANSLKFEIRGGYKPVFGDLEQKVDWQLASGSRWTTLTGPDIEDHHNGMGGLGLEWKHSNFSVNVGYDAQFGAHHLEHAVNTQFKLEF